MPTKNSKICNESNDEGVPKSKVHIILEIIEYVPDSIVCRTIIKNRNGKISAVAFAKGEKFCETTALYDTYVQVIDGEAQVTISGKDADIKLGEGIIIPVNTVHCFKANHEFKMITTIIKHSETALSSAAKKVTL
jgi:quercetin dioxygenase-like cupin family protein